MTIDSISLPSVLARWKNVVWQVFHLGLGGILFLGLWIFLGRAWGPDLFGRFTFMYAYASFYGIFSDIGSDLLAARITAEKQGIPESLLRLKIGILAVNFLLFMSAGIYLNLALTTLFFFLAGVSALSFYSFLNGILRGNHRLDMDAKLGMLQKVLLVTCVITGCLYWNLSILGVAVIYFMSQLLCLIMTMVGAWRYFNISKANVSILPLLKSLSALWLISLWGMVYLRLDFFVIERFLGNQELGYFSMPFKIWEGCLLMVSAYLAAVFPRLIENRDKGPHLSSMFLRSIILLGIAGTVIGLVLSLSGGYAFNILFDNLYGPSKVVINTLFPLTPVAYISAFLGIFLVALSREKTYAFLLTAGFLIHLVIDLLFIRKWGISGAVLANWVREIFLVISLFIAVRSALRDIQEGSYFNPA